MPASTVRTRFAPSPTGALHVGNLRAALLNWLYTRKMGGSIVLRFDDTDLARSTREYADAIADDLAWAGLGFDEVTRQSDRLATYDAAVDTLKARGLLYPCYETPAELDRRRKRQRPDTLPARSGQALRLNSRLWRERRRLRKRPEWTDLFPRRGIYSGQA